MSLWVIKREGFCSFEKWIGGFFRGTSTCVFRTKKEAQDAIREYIEHTVAELKSEYAPIIKEKQRLTSLFMAEKAYDKEYKHGSNWYVFPKAIGLPPNIDKYVFTPVKLSESVTPETMSFSEYY